MLAHSLHDAGTAKKLAVLVTLDTVSVEVVSQLKASSNGTKPDCPPLLGWLTFY